MLSRQASSLYWIGRYQERAENLARYLQVKYFSTMDSTMLEYRDLALRSILFMSSGNVPGEVIPEESEIIWDVAINANSNSSILSNLEAVRMNTKSIRNLISNEVWENVNKNYHFASGFNGDYLKARGLYEFTHSIQETSASFHSKLESTLLHDEVWAFIKLGISVERAIHITKTLLNTLIELNATKGESRSQAIENYQWLITLNILEATDMSRKIFKSSVQQSNACEFLITNLDFPRSIAYSLFEANTLIQKIKNTSSWSHFHRESVEYQSAKMTAFLKYLNYDEIDSTLEDFLNKILKDLLVLNDLIHQEFFENKQ